MEIEYSTEDIVSISSYPFPSVSPLTWDDMIDNLPSENILLQELINDGIVFNSSPDSPDYEILNNDLELDYDDIKSLNLAEELLNSDDDILCRSADVISDKFLEFFLPEEKACGPSPYHPLQDHDYDPRHGYHNNFEEKDTMSNCSEGNKPKWFSSLRVLISPEHPAILSEEDKKCKKDSSSQEKKGSKRRQKEPKREKQLHRKEKRERHNVSERERRKELNKRLEDLRLLVPVLKGEHKAPKVKILKSALEYINELKDKEERRRKQVKCYRDKNKSLRKRLRKLKEEFLPK